MREMLIAAMQVHLTFETVRQNEVVKRLAGWGAILAIPTMVFSWYGMNFKCTHDARDNPHEQRTPRSRSVACSRRAG